MARQLGYLSQTISPGCNTVTHEHPRPPQSYGSNTSLLNTIPPVTINTYTWIKGVSYLITLRSRISSLNLDIKYTPPGPMPLTKMDQSKGHIGPLVTPSERYLPDQVSIPSSGHMHSITPSGYIMQYLLGPQIYHLSHRLTI